MSTDVLFVCSVYPPFPRFTIVRRVAYASRCVVGSFPLFKPIARRIVLIIGTPGEGRAVLNGNTPLLYSSTGTSTGEPSPVLLVVKSSAKLVPIALPKLVPC